MVKNQHVRIVCNRLEHCASNGLLHVAIGDPVWKWQIFELFCLFWESCTLDPDYRPQYLAWVNFLRQEVALALKEGHLHQKMELGLFVSMAKS